MSVSDIQKSVDITVGSIIKVTGGRKVPINTIGNVFWIGENTYGWSVGFKDTKGREYFTALKNVDLERKSTGVVQTRLGGTIDCTVDRIIIIPNEGTIDNQWFRATIEDIEAAQSTDGTAWSMPIAEFETVLESFRGFAVSPILRARLDLYYKRMDIAKHERVARSAKRTDQLLRALGGLDGMVAGKPLYRYQKEGIRWMIECATSETLKGAILADDMGLGKTRQALTAARAFLKHCNALIRIISPAAVRSDWRKEMTAQNMREHAGLFGDVELLSWAKITHHKVTLHDGSVRPFVIIADEGHYASGPSSQRTQAYLREAARPECLAVWVLTGTPLRNSQPTDIWAILKGIGHPVAQDLVSFRHRFKGRDAAMIRLSEHLKGVILRRKAEGNLELPAFSRIMREFDLTKEARDIYHSEFKRLQSESPHASEALVKLMHLRQAASIAKVSDTVDLAVKVIGEGDRPVIFTNFKNSARLIKIGIEQSDAFKAMGFDEVPELFTGDVPDKSRDRIKKAFMEKRLPALVVTIECGGTGVDGFQYGSSTVILHERPLIPSTAFQGEKRVSRNGQKKPVRSFWQQADLDVDRKLDEMIQKKYSRAEMALTGHGALIDFDETEDDQMSIERELAKIVKE